MATKQEIEAMVLPSRITDQANAICEENYGKFYGSINSALRDFIIESVIDDESIHPVAAATFASSASTSLISAGGINKYHPVLATERKLAAMRGLLAGMRSGEVTLLFPGVAIKNVENPQITAELSVDDSTNFQCITSNVLLPIAGAAGVGVDSDDLLDMNISRRLGIFGYREDSLLLDSSMHMRTDLIKKLTGVDKYETTVASIRKTIPVGLARGANIIDTVEKLKTNDSMHQALASTVAVKLVDSDDSIPFASIGEEGTRNYVIGEISRVITGLACGDILPEGVRVERQRALSSESSYFRRRVNPIAGWTIEQTGVVLDCFGIEVDDLIPERANLTVNSSLTEVTRDVINHQSINETFRDLKIRLAGVVSPQADR